MQYSIIGFPRIGMHRELKFTTEKYFRHEISEKEFFEIVEKLRIEQWKLQQKEGVSYIPSNDFSLYDGMLDTAFMLNAIPARYRAFRISDIDTYFAMARGYQSENLDVTALAMKKWFHTNYHYMVPELEDDMKLKLSSEAFLAPYRQALSNGIQTKPVVIGPFTFLHLAKCMGEKTKQEYLPELAQAYKELLAACDRENVEWIQIDEPYLVMDLEQEEVAEFDSLYQDILSEKHTVKVLLQTYFGDVRDCYETICKLPFDGIGLDFLEGKKSFELIEKHEFPKGKVLFAGLVNGRNIWKTNYEKCFSMLKKLRVHCEEIVLGTSCSLLHVPYTVKNESKLDENIKKYFAFAVEKLEELRELSALAEEEDYQNNKHYLENQRLFQEDVVRRDDMVQKQLRALTEDDFHRKMPRVKRQKIQRVLLELPPLPTTTIGSFPQTKEVKHNRTRYRKGEIDEETYRKTAKGFIKDCIRLQEEIGLDVLVHGEFERNDMVEFFGENLSGYVFTENGWVQSYGTRGVKPPIIFGDIKRVKSITTDYIAYANSLTEKDVKGMLTGPVTILNWSFPREDISIQEMMYQIALAIREEVLELEDAGVRIIQIDEAALREKLPLRKAEWYSDYLDFAIKAFRICHAKVKPETQIHTHMCYSEFEDIIPAIDDMDADVITFEASRSKFTILKALKENAFETEVGPGVYDIHSPRIPSVQELEQVIRLMMKDILVEKLWVNPDCGLKTRGETETVESLKHMVAAVKNIRKSL